MGDNFRFTASQAQTDHNRSGEAVHVVNRKQVLRGLRSISSRFECARGGACPRGRRHTVGFRHENPNALDVLDLLRQLVPLLGHFHELVLVGMVSCEAAPHATLLRVGATVSRSDGRLRHDGSIPRAALSVIEPDQKPP